MEISGWHGAAADIISIQIDAHHILGADHDHSFSNNSIAECWRHSVVSDKKAKVLANAQVVKVVPARYVIGLVEAYQAADGFAVAVAPGHAGHISIDRKWQQCTHYILAMDIYIAGQVAVANFEAAKAAEGTVGQGYAREVVGFEHQGRKIGSAEKIDGWVGKGVTAQVPRL